MGTQEGWFHCSDFDHVAVDESTQRLCVGRPGGTAGRRTYVWFVISKKLVDHLHLGWVLPVPEVPVKDRDGGGLWLGLIPVVGDAKRVMVLWLIPANQSHSDFLLPPHSDTSLYPDLLGDWHTHRPLLSKRAVVYSTGDTQYEWVESGFTWSQNASTLVRIVYQKRGTGRQGRFA